MNALTSSSVLELYVVKGETEMSAPWPKYISTECSVLRSTPMDPRLGFVSDFNNYKMEFERVITATQ